MKSDLVAMASRTRQEPDGHWFLSTTGTKRFRQNMAERMTKTCFAGAAVVLAAALSLTDAVAQTYTISIATGNVRPHPTLAMADYIKEQLEARSDGQLGVRIFSAGQLGGQQDMLEQARMGVVDIAINVSQNVAPFVPEMQIFQMSYLFPGYDAFRAVISQDSPVYEVLAESVEQNLDSTLLALSGGGTRNVSNMRGPVIVPEDMSGLKMRVGTSPVTAAIWRAVGTVPVTVAFGETYSAMQTGLIEATESSISAYDGSKFYEVAKHLAMTEHEFMVSVAIASNVALARLPEDLRELVIEVGRETESIGTDFGIETDGSIVASLVDKYDVEVTQPNKEAFIDRVVPLHDQIAEEMGVEDLLKSIREIIAKTQ